MNDDTSSRLGRFLETSVAGETVRAFVPPPLPPNPPVDIMSLSPKLSLAERALGRLDGITVLLPRQELFLYMYVRKEAALSSQIEGTLPACPRRIKKSDTPHRKFYLSRLTGGGDNSWYRTQILGMVPR